MQRRLRINMSRLLVAAAILASTLSSPSRGAAQEDVSRFAVPQIGAERIGDAVLGGGVLGGLLGAGAGWLAFRAVSDSPEAQISGALIGATVGIPLGVHIANNHRGSVGLSLAASAVILAGGLGLALSEYSDGAFLVVGIVVPLLQVATSVAIESETASR